MLFSLNAPRQSLRSVAGFACVLPNGLRLQAQSASRMLPVDRLPDVKKSPVFAAHVALKDYLRVAENDWKSGRSAPDTPGKLAFWSRL